MNRGGKDDDQELPALDPVHEKREGFLRASDRGRAVLQARLANRHGTDVQPYCQASQEPLPGVQKLPRRHHEVVEIGRVKQDLQWLLTRRPDRAPAG